MNTTLEPAYLDTCYCDVDGRCDFCPAEVEAQEWARILGLTPAPYDSRGAYEESDYKGRFDYGWDAA